MQDGGGGGGFVISTVRSFGSWGLILNWVLEYYTLTLFLVLGSYYSYLYLKSIYFLFRVYSKAKSKDPIKDPGFRVQGLGSSGQVFRLGCSPSYERSLLTRDYHRGGGGTVFPIKDC